MELIEAFEALKISALGKSKLLNSSIHDVTIGPDSLKTCETSTIIESDVKVPQKAPEVKPDKPSLKSNAAYKVTLEEIEFERRNQVADAISSRIDVFKAQSAQKGVRNKAGWAQSQLRLAESIKKQEICILNTLSQHDLEKQRRDEEVARHYEMLAKKKLEDFSKQQEREQKTNELKVLIELIKEKQKAFRKEYQEIVVFVKSIDSNIMKELYGHVPDELKKLYNCMDGIVKNCLAGKISIDEAIYAENVLLKITELKNMLINNDQMLKESINAPTQQENTEIYENAKDVVDTPAPVETVEKKEDIVKQKAGNKLLEFGSKNSLILLTNLENFAEEFYVTFKELEGNDALKQYKFDLKKAINIPVNAICAISRQHLTEKLSKISNLLNGNNVTIGQNVISASRNPQGVNFCIDLLAKKFVLQGDLIISSNFDTAYAYAYVIVQLWSKHPTFGKLLLVEFYKSCPYLLPYYPPNLKEQSEENFYRSQGYQYSEGTIEKQDKFLKRMTGFMRLYATILICKSSANINNDFEKPYGIVQAWTWLASILNLKPRPQITATMLHVFLETAGFSLQLAYGKQFKKVIDFLMSTFLPVLEKVDFGAPVARLRGLLDDYKEHKCQFPRPDRSGLEFLERDFYV